MAACQINIGGAGTVLIRYNLDGINNEITAASGDPVFIDDTAINVTYTVLTGVATVTSGCLIITNLIRSCYLYSYSFANNCVSCTGLSLTAQTIYKFKYLLHESIENMFVDTMITLPTPETLGDQINILNLPNVQATAYRVTAAGSNTRVELILTVFGTDVPEIVAESPVGPDKMYFKGTPSVCLPAGFTSINVC